MRAELCHSDVTQKAKTQRDILIVQSEGYALHAPGYIMTVCRNEGTRTMFQDCRRWKKPKLSYRNKFLGANSGINCSQNQTPLSSESELIGSLQKEDWKLIYMPCQRPTPGYRLDSKVTLPCVQFPMSYQQKPLPKLSPAIPQTQLKTNLMSLTKIQDVPPLLCFALHYVYQHNRENRANKDLRRQFHLSPILKRKPFISNFSL